MTRIGADLQEQTVAEGTNASSPNGVVLDAANNRLFYTEYNEGKVQRVDLGGANAPVEVTAVAGAALDGLAMDACGNVYAVDQGGSRLYRSSSMPRRRYGEAELLAEFDDNVPTFSGLGAGFDPKLLYAAGNPGSSSRWRRLGHARAHRSLRLESTPRVWPRSPGASEGDAVAALAHPVVGSIR